MHDQKTPRKLELNCYVFGTCMISWSTSIVSVQPIFDITPVLQFRPSTISHAYVPKIMVLIEHL